MADQADVHEMGGTQRLGLYPCKLKPGSVAAAAYDNQPMVEERHRHRFEFNNDFKEEFEKAGMKCTGVNPETGLVEVVEVPANKWYLGVQFHPEYNSTVISPNPLFVSFLKAIIENKENK